ncbi:hypothetical protein VOLCADRAFT_104668 [Volvox carteri f. nagariensis]|uniref:Uncharacterized protein n=1 Tax=Volvox carteri f. nagariensis TaxID=3068 RepID=D8TVN1_VOLCA|nr:uncharacterized protein VOLCADRAFT_104668 [Volvox carteri f. nagariensis]EFJ48613.1 hypothetical protein VOLCADRAFT_104668 [Volvox carteri f. nagariensis]|eukprot:XP_002950412.1 hypothetical protein VOLCADRAFT_104668 [Volvox carteri f. nagariensis]
MHQSRQREQEPTRWYRLADSRALFTALHETPNEGPLLPVGGQTRRSFTKSAPYTCMGDRLRFYSGRVSPLRRYVAMQYTEVPTSWMQQEGGRSGKGPQVQIPLGSFSSAETVVRPLASFPFPYGADQPPTRQHDGRLQQSLPERQQQQPQQGINFPVPSMSQGNPDGPPGPAARNLYAPYSAVEPAAWQATEPAAFTAAASARPAAEHQHGTGNMYFGTAQQGAMVRGPTFTSAAGDVGGYIAPVHEGLTPAAAVAAVAAVEFGATTGAGGGQELHTVALPGPAASRPVANTHDSRVQRPVAGIAGAEQVQRQSPNHGNSTAVDYRPWTSALDYPPYQLQGILWRGPSAPLTTPAYNRGPEPVSKNPAAPPYSTNSITAIQQWLLLVPDHSKAALAKAWSTSVQRAATAAVFSSSLGRTGAGGPATAATTAPAARVHNNVAALWGPASRRAPPVAAATASKLHVQSPQPALLSGVAMKAHIYHPADTALTPELVLRYTNLLYGEDWGKGNHFTQLQPPEPPGPNMAAGISGGSSLGAGGQPHGSNRHAVMASGTQRLYNMYNQLLGRNTASMSPKGPALTGPDGSQELLGGQARRQPLACLPYMPDLAEHVAKGGVSSDVPPSKQALESVPKAAVWQAAWAAQRAAAGEDLPTWTSPVAAPTAGRVSSSNSLYACEDVPLQDIPATINGGMDAAGYDDTSATQQLLGKQTAPQRWDRKRMESVLAPVFVVDFDNSQVTITYLNGHGRSEVETQTDQCSPKVVADNYDDLGTASQQSSAMGSGTDVSADSSSAVSSDDDNSMASSPSSSTMDKHYPADPSSRAATTKGSMFQQLLRNMNIFSRWRHQRDQATCSATGGKGGPLQRHSSAAFGGAASASHQVADSRDVRSDEGGEDSTDNGTVSAAAATLRDGGVTPAVGSGSSPKKKGKDALASSSAHGGGATMKGKTARQTDRVGGQKKRTRAAKAHKVQERANAGRKAAADTNGKEPRKSGAPTKLREPAAGDVATATPAAAVDGRGMDEVKKESKKSVGVLTGKSHGAATAANSTATGGMGDGVDSHGGESGREDSPLDGTTKKPAGGSRLKKGSRGSKTGNFRLWWWKQQARGTPAVEMEGGGPTNQKSTGEPAERTQEPVKQASAVAVAAGDSADEASPRKSARKGGKASRLLKEAELNSGSHHGGPKKADNRDTHVEVEEVKDNIAGDTAGPEMADASPVVNDDPGKASGSAVSKKGKASGRDATPAGTRSGGGSSWFRSMVGSSMLGWLPKAKQQPKVAGPAPGLQPGGEVDSKQQKHTNAASKQQPAGDHETVHAATDQVTALDGASAGPVGDTLVAVASQRDSEGEVDGVDSSSLPADQAAGAKAELDKAKDDEGPPASDRGDQATERKSEKRKSNAIGGLFARILGRHRSSSSSSHNVQHMRNKTAAGGKNVLDSTTRAPDGEGLKTTTAPGPGGSHPSVDIGKQHEPRNANKQETNADDASEQLAAATLEREEMAVEPAPMAASVASSSELPETAMPAESAELQATITGAEKNIEAKVAAAQVVAAKAGSSTSAANKPGSSQGVKGKGKGKKRTKKAGKRSSSSSPTATLAALPPPQGPKAKLMQKLLKLSDVVNAQRAAATVAGVASPSPLAQDSRSGVQVASVSSTAATGATAVVHTSARQEDTLAQAAGPGGEGSESSEAKQVQQQEQLAATGVSDASLPHNKPGALERLKNTMTRTRGNAAAAAIADHKITKVGARAAAAATAAATAAESDSEGHGDTVVGALLPQDSNASASVDQVQDQVMWGTQRSNKHDSSPQPSAGDGDSAAGPSKPGGKATLMERMMASLRRPKHQTEVQVSFTEARKEGRKGFADADAAAGHRPAPGRAMGLAQQEQQVKGEAAAPAQGSSAVAATAAQPQPASQALTNTATRLPAQSALGASPVVRHAQQEENLMTSIRNKRSAPEQQESNPNNASGRLGGTMASSVASGGWAVQQSMPSGSNRTGGGLSGLAGSAPGSPLMQSLMRSTINKTATMIRGQDVNPSSSTREDVGAGGSPLRATAITAKQLADFGLPPSKW